MRKILLLAIVMIVLGIVGISGCTDSGNSTSSSISAADPNIDQYKQNLVNLQENPKAYVGKTVTIVGPRGFSTKHEADSYLGTLEGTEITMGDSEKVGSSSVSVWYTGAPIDLDLFSDIKVTGTFKRNSDYRYGLSDYVIVTDKVEGIQ